MKIKLDKNLAAHGKAILEMAGHDVMTVSEQDLSGAPDDRLFHVCVREERMLVTLDRDFGQTLRYPPEKMAGIVVVECKGRQSIATLNARMTELAAALREHDLSNRLSILEPGRIRIRQPRDFGDDN